MIIIITLHLHCTATLSDNSTVYKYVKCHTATYIIVSGFARNRRWHSSMLPDFVHKFCSINAIDTIHIYAILEHQRHINIITARCTKAQCWDCLSVCLFVMLVDCGNLGK